MLDKLKIFPKSAVANWAKQMQSGHRLVLKNWPLWLGQGWSNLQNQHPWSKSTRICSMFLVYLEKQSLFGTSFLTPGPGHKVTLRVDNSFAVSLAGAKLPQPTPLPAFGFAVALQVNDALVVPADQEATWLLSGLTLLSDQTGSTLKHLGAGWAPQDDRGGRLKDAEWTITARVGTFCIHFFWGLCCWISRRTTMAWHPVLDSSVRWCSNQSPCATEDSNWRFLPFYRRF